MLLWTSSLRVRNFGTCLRVSGNVRHRHYLVHLRYERFNSILPLTNRPELIRALFLASALGIVSKRNAADKEVTSFIQVSRGITFTYNPRAAPKSRLLSLTLSSVPVHPEGQYTLSTIDFVAQGGDGFLNPPKQPGPSLDTLAEVLARYIKQKSPYKPFLEGRIASVGNGDRVEGQFVAKTCHGVRCRFD